MGFTRISIVLASATIMLNSPMQASFPDPCRPLCGPPAWRAEEITCNLGARTTEPFIPVDKAPSLRMIDGKELSLEHLEGAQLPRLDSRIYAYQAMLELVINVEGRVEAIFVRDPGSLVRPDPSDEDLRRVELASKIDDRLVENHKNWVFDRESLIEDSTCTRYRLVYLFGGSEPDGNVEWWITMSDAIARLEKRRGE